MKKWIFYALILLMTMVLAACGGNGNEGAQDDGNGDLNVEQTGFDGNGDNGNNNGNNGNNNGNGEDQYELAEKAADQISKEVNGVDQAYVLKTDNNAYVAVEVERNNGNNGEATNDNGNNAANNNGTIGNNGDANNNGNGNNNGITGNNGNNNANGANNNEGDELTDDVKQEISKIVKSVDNDVENVYVSANPDFFNLANNYADDAGNGNPVEGMFDQLGNMIERVFPDNPNE